MTTQKLTKAQKETKKALNVIAREKVVERAVFAPFNTKGVDFAQNKIAKDSLARFYENHFVNQKVKEYVNDLNLTDEHEIERISGSMKTMLKDYNKDCVELDLLRKLGKAVAIDDLVECNKQLRALVGVEWTQAQLRNFQKIQARVTATHANITTNTKGVMYIYYTIILMSGSNATWDVEAVETATNRMCGAIDGQLRQIRGQEF